MPHFDRMTLVTRIVLSFAFVDLLPAGIGTVGIIQLRRADGRTNHLHANKMKRLELIPNVHSNTQPLRAKLLEAILARGGSDPYARYGAVFARAYDSRTRHARAKQPRGTGGRRANAPGNTPSYGATCPISWTS